MYSLLHSRAGQSRLPTFKVSYYQDYKVCVISGSHTSRIICKYIDRFCTSNIQHFRFKVNDLYRSLIFFVRLVHFQQHFIGNNHTIKNRKIKILQIGNKHFHSYFTNSAPFFYAYCPTVTNLTISATCFWVSSSIYSNS